MSDEKTDARMVLTTIGSAEKARELAYALVERRLAACVNIVDRVHAIYRWQNKIEVADEYLLVIKTVAHRVEDLQKAVRELHSYDMPEFVVLAVEDADPEYLRWIKDSTIASVTNISHPK